MSTPKMPPLPEWRDIDAAGPNTAVEAFVHENEPGAGDDEWREDLQAALQEAFELGYAAARAEGDQRDAHRLQRLAGDFL